MKTSKVAKCKINQTEDTETHREGANKLKKLSQIISEANFKLKF